jgi:hypothetical protein
MVLDFSGFRQARSQNCNKEILVGAVEGRKVMRKPSLQVAYLMLSLCTVTGPLSDLAHAQTAKDFVGAWIAVSNVAEQGGVKSEPYGATPQGMLIFEADGRYGLILSRKDVPKFASNSRTNGTADENKAVVQGPFHTSVDIPSARQIKVSYSTSN